jgi:hypothetical protein
VILEFRPVGLSEPLKRSWTIVVNLTAENEEMKAISIAISMLQQDIRTVERRTLKVSNLKDYIDRLKSVIF